MATYPGVIQANQPEGHFRVRKVSCLLDRETGSWNADKVRSSFLPHEVEVILGISISPHLLNESLIWALTYNGRFSVKSAYKVAQKWLKN